MDGRGARPDAGAPGARGLRRAQDERPRRGPSLCHRRSRPRPAGRRRGADLVLRHRRPRPQPRRCHRSGETDEGARRFRGEAAPSRPGQPAGETAGPTGVRRGDRRHAQRLRLLRAPEAEAQARRGAQSHARRQGSTCAVQQAAARLLRKTRPGRPVPGRPGAPRADQRVQAEIRSERFGPAAGRRAVALPGRGAHPRAVHQVRPVVGVRRRRRDQGVPG